MPPRCMGMTVSNPFLFDLATIFPQLSISSGLSPANYIRVNWPIHIGRIAGGRTYHNPLRDLCRSIPTDVQGRGISRDARAPSWLAYPIHPIGPIGCVSSRYVLRGKSANLNIHYHFVFFVLCNGWLRSPCNQHIVVRQCSISTPAGSLYSERVIIFLD